MTTERHFEHLLNDIVENGSEKQMHELAEVFVDLMDCLQEKHPDIYKKYMEQVEDIMDAEHLTQEEARAYVSHLVHKDGTRGEYFSYSKIEELSRRNPELAKYDINDVYYVINMLHSDFYKPKWDVDTYVMFALMWLDDPDAKPGKAKLHAEVFHGV